MKRDELEKRRNHKMTCKNCGKVYRFDEVVAMMDSSGLPGDLMVINSCSCGGMNYEESD